MMDKKYILTLSIGALLLLSSNLIQYKCWDTHQKNTKKSYANQTKILKQSIDSLGELTDVYTVKNSVIPGQTVQQTDLVPMKLPKTFIAANYVLDPSQLKGKSYKVALGKGTPITKDLVMDDKLDDSMREMDIVVDTIPIGLVVGDYVDFRLIYPRGEDYIVMSYKKVYAINGKSIKIRVLEEEGALYDSALVDCFLQRKNGSTTALRKYIEPGIQKPAIVTYGVPKNIASLIQSDPNILNKAVADANNRSAIDLGIGNLSATDGAAIATGRNDANSKIDNASQNYQQSQKSSQTNTQQQQQTTQPTTPQKPAAPGTANPAPSSSTSSGTTTGGMQ